MPSRLSRHLFLLALLLVGCSSGGTSCGSSTEIPGGFPLDERTDNAVTAKVSASGLRFIEDNLDEIVSTVTGGLSFNVPCSEFGPFTYDVTVADLSAQILLCDTSGDLTCSGADATSTGTSEQYEPNFNSSSGASLASRRTKPCGLQVAVRPGSVSVLPAQQGDKVILPVKLKLDITTGALMVTLRGALDVPFLDTFDCVSKCFLSYDTKAPAQNDLGVSVDVTIHLEIDPVWGHVVGFSIPANGIRPGQLVNTEYLTVGASATDECNLANVAGWLPEWSVGDLCDGVDWLNSLPFVASDVIPRLVASFEPRIQKAIADSLDAARCASCADGSECPSVPGAPTATCDAATKLCYTDKANHKCAPKRPGLSLRTSTPDALATYGAPDNSTLDIYAVAGGRPGSKSLQVEPTTGAPAQRGIRLGIMGGIRPGVRDAAGVVQAPARARCVPPATFAARAAAAPADFEAIAAELRAAGKPADADYHLGLSLSDNYLDELLFDAHQAGFFCLDIDGGTTSLLSSSLFRTFLPSLGVLTQGQDVPMLVSLRPTQAPQVIIGKGTTRTASNGQEIPDDPLLTLKIPAARIEFYALIEDRYVRLFSLSGDLSLPLSLKFNAAAGTVQPVLASLDSTLQNVRTQNGELLAEDPSVVQDLIDAVLGLVQPALANVLTPFTLPDFNGLKLGVSAMRGAERFTGQVGYQHLALLTKLSVPASPLLAQVDTQARVRDIQVPEFGTGARPTVRLDVSATGLRSDAWTGNEYAYRVDGGFWSPWSAGDVLEIRDPALVIEGSHRVEVAARHIGAPQSEDASPATVEVRIDRSAPRVELTFDAEAGTVRASAVDTVAAQRELTWRSRIGDAEWTESASAPAFSLRDLLDRSGQLRRLEVEAIDPSGHVGRDAFGTEALSSAPVAQAVAQTDAGGCTSAAPSMLSAALAALALVGRRRRRS